MARFGSIGSRVAPVGSFSEGYGAGRVRRVELEAGMAPECRVSQATDSCWSGALAAAIAFVVLLVVVRSTAEADELDRLRDGATVLSPGTSTRDSTELLEPMSCKHCVRLACTGEVAGGDIGSCVAEGSSDDATSLANDKNAWLPHMAGALPPHS